MPEYILEEAGAVNGIAFDDLDAFTRGYVKALFWLSESCIATVDWDKPESQHRIEEGTADGSIPTDAGFGDLHPASLQSIIDDCAKFQTEHAGLLAQAYARAGYGEERAGHDYWLTRNGHGAGFWDRDELEADGLGDKLSDACRHSEVNVSFGAAVDGTKGPTGCGWVFVE